MVIAIIGILIALLLPAVQAAREAARRSQCTNNTKQIVLGFNEYADTYKMFPADALWAGNGVVPIVNTGTGLRTTWCVALFPFIEQKPLYDAINKSTYVGPQGGIGSGTAAVATPGQPYNGQDGSNPNRLGPNYQGDLIGQVLPNFQCPSDGVVYNISQLGGFSFTNYAGSMGCYWGQAVQQNSSGAPYMKFSSNQSPSTQGVFVWNQPCPLAAIRDGLSNTICVAEVTSCGAGQPQSNSVLYTFDAPNILTPVAPTYSAGQMATAPVFTNPAVNPGPMPPLYYNGAPGTAPYLPYTPSNLAPGSSKSRSVLQASDKATPVPWVFRSLMAALSTTMTGEAPGTTTGWAVFPNFLGLAAAPALGSPNVGWDWAVTTTAPYVYGYQPLFNGIYGPNSNWPGADSNHPGGVIVGFGDGSARTVQTNIALYIWNMLNTRAGNEAIPSDF